MDNIISLDAIARREYWVEEIRKLSGNFGSDTERLERELTGEISEQGIPALIDHVRLCGSIPESYGHDTSEEKLYSKYTDSLLCLSYKSLGLRSLVLKERADAADVEAFAPGYSFVADAKAFRLSRTAKNQKDFKVMAMVGWQRGKDYAMVVCPIYQLPNNASQIYQQATTHNICIFTYSHLALLLNFSIAQGPEAAAALLHEIFKVLPATNPTKSSSEYWLTINRIMINFSPTVRELWAIEKSASAESIVIAKEEALTFLAKERERIMRMSHEEALIELIKVQKIDSKIRIISAIADNGLFTIN